ncbi:LOW QUALITY PROTEIN: microtubule-associated protein 2-like [Rhinophrynus dorsalis]
MGAQEHSDSVPLSVEAVDRIEDTSPIKSTTEEGLKQEVLHSSEKDVKKSDNEDERPPLVLSEQTTIAETWCLPPKDDALFKDPCTPTSSTVEKHDLYEVSSSGQDESKDSLLKDQADLSAVSNTFGSDILFSGLPSNTNESSFVPPGTATDEGQSIKDELSTHTSLSITDPFGKDITSQATTGPLDITTAKDSSIDSFKSEVVPSVGENSHAVSGEYHVVSQTPIIADTLSEMAPSTAGAKDAERQLEEKQHQLDSTEIHPEHEETGLCTSTVDVEQFKDILGKESDTTSGHSVVDEPTSPMASGLTSEKLFPDNYDSESKEASDKGGKESIEELCTKVTISEPLQEKGLPQSKDAKETVEHKSGLDEDKSGMSTYFETSALKEENAEKDVKKSSDYYELTDVKESQYEACSIPHIAKEEDDDENGELEPVAEEKVSSSAPEVGYSTLTTGKLQACISSGDRLFTIDPNIYADKSEFLSKNKDDLTLSRSLGLGGRSAIEQRSMSINLPMSCLDSIALGFSYARAHDLSPLATDILSNTSGSMDEGDECELPATTPSLEKAPSFPEEQEHEEEEDTTESEKATAKERFELEPLCESQFPAKEYYKNGTIMAPDLPEMLDLTGSRSRLDSGSADSDATRRKSEVSEVIIDESGVIQQESVIEGSHLLVKTDSQQEELGYCVFNKYTVPLPSPVQDSESLSGGMSTLYEGLGVDPSIIEVKLAAAEKLGKERQELSSEAMGWEAELEKKICENKLDTVIEKSEDQSDLKEPLETTDVLKPKVEIAEPLLKDKIESPVSEKPDERCSEQPSVASDDKLSVEESHETFQPESQPEESSKSLVAVSETDTDEPCDKPKAKEISAEEPQTHLEPNEPGKIESQQKDDAEEKTVTEAQDSGTDVPPSLEKEPKEAVSDEDFTLSKEASKLSEMDLKEKGAKPDLVHQEAVDKEESYESSGEPEQPQEPSKELDKNASLEEAPKLDKVDSTPEILQEPSDSAVSPLQEVKQEEAEEVQMENLVEPQPEETLEVMVEKDMVQQETPQHVDKEFEVIEESSKELTLEVSAQETEQMIPGEEPAVEFVEEVTGVIESVVTVEDDFIQVVQTTVEDSDSVSHSVRFAASLPTESEEKPVTEEAAEDEEEEVEELKDEQKEGSPCIPASPEKEETILTEYKTETQDDYRDETTIDDSVLDTDSIWVDTQDDDRSIMTEAIEAIPKEEKIDTDLQRTPAEKHRKEKPFKPGRGRMSTPERKMTKKEPSATSRDEARRKKAVLKKAEIGKKSEVQPHSPSRKIILKPAVKQSRPAHLSCVRRKPAGDCSVNSFFCFFANVAGKHCLVGFHVELLSNLIFAEFLRFLISFLLENIQAS